MTVSDSVYLTFFSPVCLQEKSSVHKLMVEEHEMARQDLQYRLKLAEDEQRERLKVVRL